MRGKALIKDGRALTFYRNMKDVDTDTQRERGRGRERKNKHTRWKNTHFYTNIKDTNTETSRKGQINTQTTSNNPDFHNINQKPHPREER